MNVIKYVFLFFFNLSIASINTVKKIDSTHNSGPLIAVYGNLLPINNADFTPSLSDNTIFLSCQVDGETHYVNYTIVNDGITLLDITNIVVTGLNFSDFQITSLPNFTILPGESTSFTVSFDPNSVGLRTANIEISSNDPVNSVYQFSIQGNGLDYVECGFNLFEEIIVAQDFEPSSIVPVWNYNITSGIALVDGGTAYAESGIPLPIVNRFIGTKSLQVNNSNCSLLFDSINTLNIKDVSFNFRLSSLSKTPADGSENADYVSVAISTNGGISWSNEIQVTGSSQAKWSFASGDAVAQSTFLGTDFIVNYTPTTTGFLTTDGYSMVNINGLPKTNDLRIRLTIVNNNNNEIWAIDEVKLIAKKQASTTWNGSVWSNGLPNNFTKAILDGNYSTGINGSLTTCKCQINIDKTLSVDTNTSLASESDITNFGSFIVEDGGTVIQKDDFAVNYGAATIKRNATIRMFDYVYWSSPIEQFSLNLVSPNTPLNYLWKWNATITNPNGGLGFWIPASGDTMEKGKGYIVRSPSGFSAAPQIFNAIFSGSTINNGLITQSISRGSITSATLSSFTSLNGVPFSVMDDNWNLIGNPFPSALNVDAFLQYNAIENPVIEGAVRLWTHGTPPSSTINPFYSSYQYNYTANDYITHNATATLSGPTGFNGDIASCQGFFVLMNEGTMSNSIVTFKNSMRDNFIDSNTQFYKNSANSTSIEKHRIWLDLVDVSGYATRTVIGYLNNATNEKDVLYDAFASFDGNQNFYSLIDNQMVCIQGRPLPFDTADVVPLGYSIPNSGNYTIAIGALDGLFESNQSVYLEDTLLNTIHNLKQSPYQFYSNSGINDNRFLIKYEDSSLATNDFISENNVIVACQNETIAINSSKIPIKSFKIYDLLGSVLVSKNGLNQLHFVIDYLVSTNQALLINIQLNDGTVVIKKILY